MRRARTPGPRSRIRSKRIVAAADRPAAGRLVDGAAVAIVVAAGLIAGERVVAERQGIIRVERAPIATPAVCAARARTR